MKSLFNPIGWCHFTVNFWWGCTKVSPACKNCYAENLNKVRGKGLATWGAEGLRRIRTEAAIKELRAYDRRAAKNGVRYRVFINSMSDTFEDRADLHEARQELFYIARELKHLDLLLLTKRPENVMGMVPYRWQEGEWPRNVWLGTTVENQEWADKRVPELLKIPAAVRFLSVEPMLGPVDLGEWLASAAYAGIIHGNRHSHDGGYSGGEYQCDECDYQRGEAVSIHQVICGGESGPQARPMHPDWARGLRDQCAAAGVPFYFKQWGEYAYGYEFAKKTTVLTVVNPDGSEGWIEGSGDFESLSNWSENLQEGYAVVRRVGREAAGRLLDGVEHNGFPGTEERINREGAKGAEGGGK